MLGKYLPMLGKVSILKEQRYMNPNVHRQDDVISSKSTFPGSQQISISHKWNEMIQFDKILRKGRQFGSGT
jgi:hypothetical protein